MRRQWLSGFSSGASGPAVSPARGVRGSWLKRALSSSAGVRLPGNGFLVAYPPGLGQGPDAGPGSCILRSAGLRALHGEARQLGSSVGYTAPPLVV